MNNFLQRVQSEIYSNCNLEISEFITETESKEYDACRFKLNGTNIVCRNAKITPKKVGQFVTFWKRKGKGPIEPFHKNDGIDFFVVNICSERKYGQFVFPATVLINKGVLSTDSKEGKRAFRVYPSWDNLTSKQAMASQKWQLDYFYEIVEVVDFKKVLELYSQK